MIGIDHETAYPQLQQFATQKAHIPEDIKAMFDAHFQGNKSPEFYQGLLTGYANA